MLLLMIVIVVTIAINVMMEAIIAAMMFIK
jgi:hypothetical protein